MSIFVQVTDEQFTRDMSLYTNITTTERQTALDNAESFWIDVLTGHGYKLPATTVVVSTILATGTSYGLRRLVTLKAAVDLISGPNIQPESAEIWRAELEMIWGQVKSGRFVTSHFFTETGSTTWQRGTISSMKVIRG